MFAPFPYFRVCDRTLVNEKILKNVSHPIKDASRALVLLLDVVLCACVCVCVMLGVTATTM